MKFFFVLALGRSGTALIADLLSHSEDQEVRVNHEPSPIDPKLMCLRYSGSFDDALDGMLRKRFQEVLANDADRSIYGEVNSYLRYESRWLRKTFSPAILHLVRDGRDFVRSAYTRTVYTPWEEHLPIVPKDDDPYAAHWSHMDRFEKLCWYWRHTNEMLQRDIADHVRLEDVLESYEHARNQLIEPLGLEIPFETWRSAVERPKNTSKQNIRAQKLRNFLLRRHRPRFQPLPHWSRWDSEKKRRFWEICGDVMQSLGYSTP